MTVPWDGREVLAVGITRASTRLAWGGATREGKVYCCVVVDADARRVVG